MDQGGIKLSVRAKRWARRWALATGLHNPFVPRQIWPDDVFFVSYPRSGSTWLRFLLANLVKVGDEAIDFHNVARFIPEVADLASGGPYASPRIIRTHAPYQKRYPRTIYLVRDGRDVYLSYYHHQGHKMAEDTTLAAFLASDDHWPGRWSDHVAGWLDAGLDQQRLLLVRYEDLRQDTAGELRRMADFAGLAVSDEGIAGAVAESAFDRMRRMENSSGHPRAGKYSGQFVRQGKSGGWRDAYTAEDLAIFNAKDGPVLARLGYPEAPAP